MEVHVFHADEIDETIDWYEARGWDLEDVIEDWNVPFVGYTIYFVPADAANLRGSEERL